MFRGMFDCMYYICIIHLYQYMGMGDEFDGLSNLK